LLGKIGSLPCDLSHGNEQFSRSEISIHVKTEIIWAPNVTDYKAGAYPRSQFDHHNINCISLNVNI
jgi:hypothetical protein